MMESKSSKTSLSQIKVRVSSKVKDRGNDPYFVKKADESKVFLEKYGFPAELIRFEAEKLKK